MKVLRMVLPFLVVFAVAGLVVGCTPQPSSESTQEAGQNTSANSQAAWSPDSDCISCHADCEAPLEQKHTSAQTSCIMCHVADDALMTAHDGADAQTSKTVKKLSTTKVDSAMCQGCHVLSDLAEKTTDCTVLTDANGKTVNPHSLPAGHFPDKVECFDCHIVHKDKEVVSTAPGTCNSCHHAEVYECGTCHE